MANRYGRGRFAAPPKDYKPDTLLVTCVGGNVYNGDIIAKANWTVKGFLLLKGALIKKSDTIHSAPGVELIRTNLKRDKLLIDFDAENYKLKEDVLISSPSYAANLVHGNDRNGRECWTNLEGTWLKNLI